jgi:hypothetical protein
VTSSALAAPATLSCTTEIGINWWVKDPQIIGMGDEDLGSPIVHLNPADGEWHLEVPGSRALVNDGGRFEIVRTSEFGAYYHEWVGIDHGTMLRIRGGGDAPMRFLFVDGDWGPVIGACVEPDETFILLGEMEPMINLNNDWRDATSDHWIMRWGVSEGDPWLEQELGLTPGRYRVVRGDERLTFGSPRHAGEQHTFPVYELIDETTGRRWRHINGEITNGVGVIGYWAGDHNG